MKCSTRLMKAFIVLNMFYLICPQKAYAYLDPGTGSYILQLIIAGLLGASLAVKIFWTNIKTFFSNIFSKAQKTEDDNK